MSFLPSRFLAAGLPAIGFLAKIKRAIMPTAKSRVPPVYRLLEIPNRLPLATTDEGYRAASPYINGAWQTFFEQQTKNP